MLAALQKEVETLAERVGEASREMNGWSDVKTVQAQLQQIANGVSFVAQPLAAENLLERLGKATHILEDKIRLIPTITQLQRWCFNFLIGAAGVYGAGCWKMIHLLENPSTLYGGVVGLGTFTIALLLLVWGTVRICQSE